MKTNATERGHRISRVLQELLPDYDRTCIVLRFSEYGVEAAVHSLPDGSSEIGSELLSGNGNTSKDIPAAMRDLEESLRSRVDAMAKELRLAGEEA